MKLKPKHLKRFGWNRGPEFSAALEASRRADAAGIPGEKILEALDRVRSAPGDHLKDPIYGDLAQVLAAEPDLSGPPDMFDQSGSSEISAATAATRASCAAGATLRAEPVPCAIWGIEGLDAETLRQMDAACRLPIAVRGAQMPDGHVGYGLPIGGVLATRNAVIPYGVGVDIACRMKISVLDAPASRLAGMRDRLKKALLAETLFGVGAEFPRMMRREHDAMDDPAWRELPKPLAQLRDKAWGQLGTSGSGNHFVEFGDLTLERAAPELGLAPGNYLALLSHSGSRGFGSNVAGYFTRLAIRLTRLPKAYQRLAWLDLRKSEGREYWAAMNLAGRYAAANHDLIHRHVLRALGFDVVAQVENHHNFAWIEEHGGERLVVHRKGATPAGPGVLGMIPGSMTDPGFIVRGKGNSESLNSAAHGAGRLLSRRAAKTTLTRSDMRRALEEAGVELMAAGLDESPRAYNSRAEVMRAQSDLVEPIARFQPRIVRMSDDGTAED